jgi:hypothetical protein
MNTPTAPQHTAPETIEAILTYKQLEDAFSSIIANATDCSAGYPPDGYENLTGDELRIADESWHNGMNSVKTAVLNWFYDQAQNQYACAPRLKREHAELVELAKELLFAAENADETGYVTDVGFIDLDALHGKTRALLARVERGAE